jgi:Nucleotidyl transferase AbiEii toxin, Type IV TA system
MLPRPQVQRYAVESGLRDITIAEKEVVLTYLLQLLSERGLLDRFAFKGDTCLRKMVIGSQGRFSTDLDFTGLEKHDHETVILDMMAAFQQPYHGIQFTIPDDSYYETQDGLSWGVNPTYAHDWNDSGESEIRLQISLRETPTLAAGRRAQCQQSYFGSCPSRPPTSLAWLCQRPSPRRSAPAISGTRRATFMILAVLQPDRWTVS